MQDPNSSLDAVQTDAPADMQTNIESVIHQDELQTIPTEAVVSRANGNGNGDKGRVKVSATNGNTNGSANGNSNGSDKQSSHRLNNAPGLTMQRRFTKPGEDVYSTVEWEIRSAVIANERGEKVFEQTGVEIPKTWTQLATNVVVSKYFRGHIGTPEREHSVRQLISRVADTIAMWGRKMDYFATETDAQTFQDELTHILLHQKAAFNSPVWFNVGLADQPVPQASACFINGVEDTMESILTLAKTEGMLFKYGSGTGTNLSTIRGSNEPLRGGGTASGPLSFMRGFDQLAGAVKSGGKCFKRGTLVAAPEGWLPIETLQIGDMVLTHKGPRPVADFMPNGWKPCYKVTTEEGYEIEVTQGHKFAYWNVHEGRFDVKPIEDFLMGEAMYVLMEASEGGTTIPLVTPPANDSAHATTTAEMTMPTELNDRLGYILGLMYGDAELRTEYPYRVRVAFCKDAAGRDSLARFRQYSQEVFGEEPLLLGDHEGHQQVGFTRKRMVEFLTANGLAKGKANDLGFPKMLFQARPEVRAAFIAGYIDADGSYQKRGGWQISSVDRPFLVELQRLLLTLGVPSKLKLNREAQGNWQDLYRLHIVGHTFIARLVERILPYSAKANLNYVASEGTDKGWGYRPSLYAPLKSRLEGRGGHGVMERKITMNETTGYRGLVATIAHPHTAVSNYAEELSHCVQVHLASVELTEMADTYDIEVGDVHLLSANGFYASNTRRAAKMALLDITHPDVEAFIVSKADEEKKAHALIDAGYSGAFNVAGGAYDSVLFQNGNHSVRVTDTFMQTYLANGEWTTRNVTDGKPNRTYKAADLMNKIGQSAWVCGDPGMQYDTTINKWHTCKNTDKINASNPCCITGDTLVAVADGRNAVAIRDLVGTETPVYAHDHATGLTTISRMWNIGVKRHNAAIHRVTLDDGSSFRVTDDHLIMQRDGSYRMVRDLKAGDSLMPFHSKVLAPAQNRTRRRHYWTGRAWQPQYRAVWQYVNGAQPEGFHIHHADFDALNDLAANLQLMPASEHNALHGDQMRGDNNPARRLRNDTWRRNISESQRGEKNGNYGHRHSDEARQQMRAKANLRWTDPDERVRSGEAVRQALANAQEEGRVIGRPRGERYERCCPVCRANYSTPRVEQIFCSLACRRSPMGLLMSGQKTATKNRGRALSDAHRAKLSVSGSIPSDPDTKRRAAAAGHRNAILKAARLLLDNDREISLSRWDAMRGEARAFGASRVPTGATVAHHFANEGELREAAQLYNHKVASVEFCGYEDVYDGTVDEHHNFAILTSEETACVTDALNYSGLFIHNSEFVFLDNTACNLSSLNLMKFRTGDGEFDVAPFLHACRVMITAQEILVDNASYPTPRIQENSHDYRPLGLGYANLGALLMARGVPYDSDAGRAYAGAITALMTGEAYHQSAVIARDHGWAFPGYKKNREPMLDVMRMHREAVETIDSALVPADMLTSARKCWDDAVATGTQHGYRNAQSTVLAPTGCLVGNSLVVTDRGLMRLTRLGNPDGAQWQAAQFSVLTDEGERQATQFYVNGIELTRRITTKAGYAIQGTLKHRVKVVDTHTGEWQWKRFADITPGDIVPLSMGKLAGEPQTVILPPLGKEYWTGDYTTVAPHTMTPELAELVGYFMGDGSLHAKGPRFCVANTDRDVAERIAHLLKSLFNLDARLIEQQGYCEVSAHSVPLALWWEACGFAKHLPHPEHTGKGYRPHVPDAILASNDPAVYGAFARGLFEADGTVTNGVPSWTTTQQTFADEVKTLLLALGVVTTIKFDTSGWGQSRLYVTRLRNMGYNARFLEAVGFISARKTALVSLSEAEQTGRYDYIYLNPDVVLALATAAPAMQNAITLAMKRHKGGITRQAAQALYEQTGDPRLAHALSFYYDTVTANDDGGEQFTYDLSVPDNVTYIANGFVSHNTIGFLMDCDTTGIEPDIAIVKYKSLVGGGAMKIVNNTVPEALAHLGYTPTEVGDIIAYIDANDTIEGAPLLKPEHLPIFDCAFKPGNGERSIHYMGHVRMMAAAQPFISGAISKCVVGSTLLTTAEGLTRISSLYEGEKPGTFRPERLSLASLGGAHDTDAFYYGGARPTMRVTLRSGHEITGTLNHRLLVARSGRLDWVRLDEIAPGDAVATQYGADMWASAPPELPVLPAAPKGDHCKQVSLPQTMTEELAWLLGAYAAEGHTTRSNWTVVITNSVESVLQRVAAAWCSEFGVQARIERQPGKCPGVVVSSKRIVEMLDALGCGGRASEKRIPDVILRSPKKMVLAFLGGLFLDGYAVADAPAQGKMAICLDAPLLLDELQAILTNLGLVHSRIHKKNKLNGKTYDEVYLCGEWAQQLIRLVPFMEPDKAATAARLLQRAFTQSTADVVPGITPAELLALIPLGRSGRNGKGTSRIAFNFLADARTKHVSRRTLERAAALPGVHLPEWLQTVLRDNLRFSPVAEVQEGGVQPVFDVSVPVTHAFVGNGIVNHNTVNMPTDATAEDITGVYVEGWKLGLKAIAIYRDGSKRTQPLNTKRAETDKEKEDKAALAAAPAPAPAVVVKPLRRKLPDERAALTHKFSIAGHEGYITVGMYPDGTPGEIFLTMSKEGSTISGLMDSFATAISLALQYGVPLPTLVDKFAHARFEPSGITNNPDIRFAKSIMDYIFRWLGSKFLNRVPEPTQPTLSNGHTEENAGVADMSLNAPRLTLTASPPDAQMALEQREHETFQNQADAPICTECGSLMVRNGACFKCLNCGSVFGCS